MPLYLGTWKIIDYKRDECMTYFASMTPELDTDERPGVKVLGRWSDICTGEGTVICEAVDYKSIGSWLYNWVPMATCSVKPILDDNAAREIILKEKPSYTVDYSNVDSEPEVGETLFCINYTFNKDSRMDGHKLFANLTEEQDKGDMGNCRSLGRWHDLGTGSGVAIAAAKSEVDIYKWAFNWASMCKCTIVPVLTDKQCREVISNKPDFENKLKTLLSRKLYTSLKEDELILMLKRRKISEKISKEVSKAESL